MFQWPTTFDFKGTLIDLVFDSDNYDHGELRAWQSASALKGLLTTLNGTYGGKVRVLAHSMGNVVAGEALRLAAAGGAGQVVNTYVASQGAVPAHCYDASLSELNFSYAHPKVPGGVPISYGPTTPNIYKNWLSGGSGAVGTRVNFYNENDYALVPPVYEFDQLTKPDGGKLPMGVYGYHYEYSGSPTDPPDSTHYFYKFHIESGNTDELFMADGNNVNDAYEIMAYAAEGRSRALGRSPTVNGFGAMNLQGIWPDDPVETDPVKKYSAHKWHSAEFRSSNARQNGYWDKLMGPDGFALK